MPPGAQPADRKLIRWAVSASLGGFLFGYQAGVVSGALLPLRRDFALNNLQQGVLVSLLPLGATIGSLLLVARALTGLAVGSASSTVPLYLSEIAPPEKRGRLVTVNQVMITLGILVSYAVDLAFSSSGSWRSMFAVGLLPAGALLVGMLRAPESPVWQEARAAAGTEPRPDFRALLSPAARPALVTGLALAAIQQLSGINAVVAYAPSIMASTGLSASTSILYSVIIGATNVAATLAALPLVDRLGRRPLLFVSLAGMLVSLGLLGLTLELAGGSSGSRLALVCLLGYVVAFAVGIGPIFWLLVAEIFPPGTRAAGAGVATAVVWLGNFTIGLAFLPVAAAIGQGPTFWIFGAVCAFGLVFVARFVPETKGRSFAEIQDDLRARWPSGAGTPAGSRRRAAHASRR